MKWTSILAIYALFWSLSIFLVLPFRVRTTEEMGHDSVPGQMPGAPGNFRPLRIVGYTTLLATVLFAVYYLNYVNGWIRIDQLNFFQPPAGVG